MKNEKSARQFVHEWLGLMDQARKVLDSFLSEYEKKESKKMTEKEVKEQIEELCPVT